MYHRIAWNFDDYGMQTLSKNALGVLEDNIKVEEAFHLIDQYENVQHFNWLEHHYCNFPGHIVLIPLLASTGSVVFFGGTWIDFSFGCMLNRNHCWNYSLHMLNPSTVGGCSRSFS